MNPSLALLLTLVLSGAAGGAPAASEPVRTDPRQSQLVAESTAAVPGTRLTLGLRLEHDPRWHTYWLNPGDSGLPTKIAFDLPDGVTAEPIAWPHPHRFEVAGIVNYGYGDRMLLPVTLAIPADYAAPTLPVRATADWLICEEECIPGEAEYAFELPVAAEATADPRWADAFAGARAARPADLPAKLVVATDGDHVVLEFADLTMSPAAWTWFPESPELVANGAGPQWQRADTGWLARWPKSEYFTTLPDAPVFVAVDDAGTDGTAPVAWRVVGTPAVATALPASNPSSGRALLRWWPVALFAVVAVAIVRLLRSKSRSRSEETDR